VSNVNKQTESREASEVNSHLGSFILLAVGLIVLGWLDIAVPFVSSLAIQNLIGIVLVIGGIMYIVQTFQWRISERVVPGFFIGILYVAFGLLLLASPVRAIFTLAFMLGIFFFIEGIFKIAQSIRTRPSSGWEWMLFSGIVSIVLALFTWSGRPMTAFWVIGFIVGVNFLIGGFSVLMIGLKLRSAVRSGQRVCIGGECFQA
jgi:uncharacterized membrane protein HdeD (DUF308 family)